MINNKFLLPIFILVALAQLYVPAKMILDREDVLTEGKAFKFKTAPVDPNDPFRGKFIRLDYVEDAFVLQQDEEWNAGEPVFVQLTTDEEGYAKILDVLRTRPGGNSDYITATVNYLSESSAEKKLFIDFPFDRYYMEESKAYEAEQIYREASRNNGSIAYALIHVKDGEGVLSDVLVDGISIKDLVEKQQNESR